MHERFGIVGVLMRIGIENIPILLDRTTGIYFTIYDETYLELDIKYNHDLLQEVAYGEFTGYVMSVTYNEGIYENSTISEEDYICLFTSNQCEAVWMYPSMKFLGKGNDEVTINEDMLSVRAITNVQVAKSSYSEQIRMIQHICGMSTVSSSISEFEAKRICDGCVIGFNLKLNLKEGEEAMYLSPIIYDGFLSSPNDALFVSVNRYAEDETGIEYVNIYEWDNEDILPSIRTSSLREGHDICIDMIINKDGINIDDIYDIDVIHVYNTDVQGEWKNGWVVQFTDKDGTQRLYDTVDGKIVSNLRYIPKETGILLDVQQSIEQIRIMDKLVKAMF